MKIAVLGNGLVGNVIAKDLAEMHNVSVFDSNSKNFGNNTNNISYQEYDLLHNDYKIFVDFDLIVLAIPGSIAFGILKKLISLKKNIVDISFFPEKAKELHQYAVENDVSVVVDCGVAPGLCNMFLGYHASNSHASNSKVESYKCFVGGLPFERKSPWEYKAPFSPTDVLEEYTRPVYIRENGIDKVVEAMTGIEQIDIDSIGTLDAFYTDGLRSLLDSFPNIPNLVEKTLRYPGYIQKIKFLKEAGFLNTEQIEINGIKVSPFELTSKLLIDDWRLTDEMEFTAMRVEIETEEDKFIYNLFDNRDVITGYSSMARTTGFTANAVVDLFSKNKISEKGIIFPENIGANKNYLKEIYDYLEERNIIIEVEQK
jgi:saccharopine dehydrogenase-like NADP-dependent oxidoreductase